MSSLLERKRELAEQIELAKELNKQLQIALDIAESNPNINDSIQLASEMGRLDIVSLVLGIFGLVIGIVAICGFWMIRGAAIGAAKAEAKKVVYDVAPEMFSQIEKLNGSFDKKAQVTLPETQQEEILGQATEVKEDEL